MKATMSDGTVIDGTLEEIQAYKRFIDNSVPQEQTPVVKKETLKQRKATNDEILISVLQSLERPTTVGSIAKKTDIKYWACLTSLRRIGATLVEMGSLTSTRRYFIVFPLSMTSPQPLETVNESEFVDSEPVDDNEHIFGMHDGTKNNLVKVRDILQRDGYITAKKLTEIYGHASTVSYHLKNYMKVYPNDEVFAMKRYGLYIEGFKRELKHSGKIIRRESMGNCEHPYNKFMKEQIDRYSKQGISNKDAFRMATYDWNKLKGGKQENSESPKQVFTESTKNKVYDKVIHALETRGYNQYTHPWFDAIGTHLKENGTISYDFRDAYVREDEWNNIVSMMLVEYGEKLMDIWGIKGKLVWENGTISVK